VSEVAVTVDGLGKRYQITHQRQPYGRLTETLARAARAPLDRLRRAPRETREWFWALKDVSFTVERGEVVGIIGRNGAGKSTLLKILSRITEPSTGAADLDGRVGSLLEVGTGFHPELSGRENIFLSGSILGMRRSDIARRFDEIVAFAEVDTFLDTPVKRYSSGMQVRLGFAVAAHLEPEILVVDEVLAVGDAAFQKRCLAKMGDVSHQGRTILFVSHNMPAVEALCDRAVMLESGTVTAVGPTEEVVGAYLRAATETATADLAARTDRQGDGRIRFQAIAGDLRTGVDSRLALAYAGTDRLQNVEVSVALFSLNGECAAYLANVVSGRELATAPASGTLVCDLPRLPVLPGRYRINIYCEVNGILADWVTDAGEIDVLEGDYFHSGRTQPHGYGHVAIDQRWGVES
jgi:lipopolysaccharide transport system ATP-binding protein